MAVRSGRFGGAGAACRPGVAGAGGGDPAFSEVVARAALTLYLLSTDEFVADTACFGALHAAKGKLRSTLARRGKGCASLPPGGGLPAHCCAEVRRASIWVLAKKSDASSTRFEGFPREATQFLAGL